MGTLVTQSWPGNPSALRAHDRRRGTFDAYVPHPVASWQPMLPADIAASLTEAEHELRSTSAAMAGNAANDGMFFWAESLGSSRIEGVAPSTRKVLHALARKQHAPDREFHDSVFQVIGNIDATNSALRMLADRQNLTVPALLEAHRILMDSSPTPHLGGVIRSDQNWIGGNDWHPLEGDFVPPPADRCDSLMSDLVTYLQNDDHSPLLQAAIAHAQFESIHPFGDGNGRTGRAVLYGVLKQRCAQDGMMPPVSLALSRNRDAYLNSLAEFQSYIGEPDDPHRSEALTPWLEVLTSAIHQSSSAVRNYQSAIQKVQQNWLVKSGSRRSRSVTSAAIAYLPSHPSMSVEALSKLTGYSDRRCADALRRLESLGIVQGRRADSGLRVYDADLVIDAYEVMASTICDMNASEYDYAEIVARSSKRERHPDEPVHASWQRCPLRVKSTGMPCSLVSGHGGNCRHLAHRRNPPR